ncbi:MAG: DUF6079 family protein [Verrucomicrobiota bacterium]
MKYRELIQFEPLTGAVRLQDANRKDAAKRLVSDFLISGEMAARLTGQIFPHLQLERAGEGKALLVTGNGGRGKTHLIAAVSALAEYAELAEAVTNPKAVQAEATNRKGNAGIEAIAGRFKVIRIELGASSKTLRDLLTRRFTTYLASQGVAYTFPPFTRGKVHKSGFEGMMAAFHQQFPDHGLLVVADGLQAHLEPRKGQELAEDLQFLRELGEACQHLKFRFLASSRDALFDHAQDKPTTDILHRVKEQFHTVALNTRDAAYIVAERLTRKTPEQKAQVQSHLARFAKYYGNLKDRMSEFVALFPLHPDFLTVCEKINFAEGQCLLRAVSDLIKQRLDEPLPQDDPGLIAYDHYWDIIHTRSAWQSIPEIEAVTERYITLNAKLGKVLACSDQQDLARRLLNALCVYRLATSDIYCQTGATAPEFRDLLCLCRPGLETDGVQPAEKLLAEVKEVLTALHQATGNQILSFNPENQQYYLNFQKFRRFVRPELVLHWVNAVPFVLLMLTGGIMAAARFFQMNREWMSMVVLVHKVFAIFWITALPLVVLLRPKVHWAHIRIVLSWGKKDLLWMVQSVRSLYDKKAVIAAVGRFNTGQKINASLVMVYFIGFGLTGLLMLFKGTILVPWYLHAALFFATTGSVGGHLFLALLNPSTRIALMGIFHGWSPMEYVEHHHTLSLPPSMRSHAEPASNKTIMEEIFVSKVEVVILAVAVIMAILGAIVFSQAPLASAKQQFSKHFSATITPNQLSTKHRLGPAAESCTKCHAYAGEIPDAKCVECHKDVQARRVSLAGYHGTLKGSCISCHKEHLAMGKSIVPLVKEKFDHNLASFKKEGKHIKVNCDECHKKTRTKDTPGIYYIGIKYQQCTDCHRDQHNQQFAANTCEKCHTVNGWTGKDLKFAHDKDSTYKLTDKHASVECYKCHKPKAPATALGTAVFKGLSQECVACHEDPHRKQFAAQCTTCHTPKGWNKELLTFEHNKDSKFKLTEKHTAVACDKCHKPELGKKLASALFRGLKSECVECHKDPHNRQFQQTCAKCHAATGWKKELLAFDHNKDSKFKLTDKHAAAACDKCHKPTDPEKKLASAQFRGLKSECVDCHKDPHNGQFQQACTKCHTAPTTWTIKQLAFDHTKDTKFTLTGRHIPLECVKCHKPTDADKKLASAKFKGLDTTCDKCHTVKHPEQYGSLCVSCHSTANPFIKKDPGTTHILRYTCFGEALTGKHLKAKCNTCHEPAKIALLGQLTPADQTCLRCHQKDDAHKGMLDANCTKCHGMEGWKGEHLQFDHNTMSSYRLNQDHKNVACAKCHKDGKWKPVSTACESCHPKFFEGGAKKP